LTALLRLVAFALAATLALAACTSPDRPSVVPDQVELPTPMRSFDASVERTVEALEAALLASSERLGVPTGAYRPSEPASLLQTPRVIRRVELADPDDGFVVIYEAENRGAALERAAELADYVESGFGQTNFVADTQFSVSTLEDTVIFSTWSQRRSDDPERAQGAFDAIASVGTPIEISK
jgi:hypothetical protein